MRILKKKWRILKKMEDFEKKWRGDFGSSWKNIQPCFTLGDALVFCPWAISPPPPEMP